jgi:hypothetical protein
LAHLTSELEIARVQLIQLRGTGAGQAVQQEMQNLNAELQSTRKSLAEAVGNRCKYFLKCTGTGNY